jgi:hypothetical protein
MSQTLLRSACDSFTDINKSILQSVKKAEGVRTGAVSAILATTPDCTWREIYL